MTQSTKDIRELIMQSSGLWSTCRVWRFLHLGPLLPLHSRWSPLAWCPREDIPKRWPGPGAVWRSKCWFRRHQRLHCWQIRSKVVLRWCIFYWYIVQMITYKDVTRDPTQGDTPSPVIQWQERRDDWRVPPRFRAGYYPGNVIDIDHSQTHHLLTVTDIHHIETIKTLTP